MTIPRPPRPDSFFPTVRSFIPELTVAGGLLALATVGFFWQILLTPNHWMPAGGGDLAPFLYPNYRFAAQHLQAGTLPLWNPHQYSGTPFAADIQTGLFYPLNWVIFFLVPDLTYEWLEYLAIFHFWLAGVTMYLCLRWLILPGPDQTRLHPLAAFAGAIAFEFSDLFIVHFGNLNMIAVAAWLPLVFLLFHHSLLRASYGLAALSGFVLAIATLAGHIQITLFILLTLGLYTLWYGWQLFPRLTVYPWLNLSLCLIVMIGLSALLLLPAYEMSRYTPRAELPYAEAVRYSLQPGQLIGLLIPNYFGRDPALHWGPWERVETGYIGILTLMLAIIGLMSHPSKLKYYFAGLGLIALLLALGGYTLFHGWLYALVPGFNQLRAPARFILLLDFSLATLAAMGLNQLLWPLETPVRHRLKKLAKGLTWFSGAMLVIALPLAYHAVLITQDRDPTIFNRATAAATGVVTLAILISASLIWLQWRCRTTISQLGSRFGMAAILIISLDLFTLGYDVDVGQTNPTRQFDHPAALAFLHDDPSFFRIEVTTDVWHVWQPNTAMLTGLYDVWGLYNPLTLADTTLYWSGAPPRSSGRYNLLGIKYIIASKAGAPADGEIVPVFDGDPEINIYLNLAALNRLLFVPQAEMVANHDAAWQAIRAADFDPTQTVILESPAELLPLNEAPTPPAPANLALLQYDLHTVTIAVETEQPGYVVLTDAYYPGWQATLNGQPTPLYRANYAFRAVYVPAGNQTIQLIFQPVIWYVGLIISGLTVLGLGGWLGYWLLKSSAKTPADSAR